MSCATCEPDLMLAWPNLGACTQQADGRSGGSLAAAATSVCVVRPDACQDSSSASSSITLSARAPRVFALLAPGAPDEREASTSRAPQAATTSGAHGESPKKSLGAAGLKRRDARNEKWKIVIGLRAAGAGIKLKTTKSIHGRLWTTGSIFCTRLDSRTSRVVRSSLKAGKLAPIGRPTSKLFLRLVWFASSFSFFCGESCWFAGPLLLRSALCLLACSWRAASIFCAHERPKATNSRKQRSCCFDNAQRDRQVAAAGRQ